MKARSYNIMEEGKKMKRNRKEKKIKKGIYEGTNTSKLYTLNRPQDVI
jgi:hypothetical protein